MATLARYAADADRLRSMAAYRAALTVISMREKVPPRDLAKRFACRRHAQLRGRALYLAVVTYGVSARAVAHAAGLSHELVARACRAIEDKRDDPEMDRLLDELQLELMPST